eukprot:403353825
MESSSSQSTQGIDTPKVQTPSSGDFSISPSPIQLPPPIIGNPEPYQFLNANSQALVNDVFFANIQNRQLQNKYLNSFIQSNMHFQMNQQHYHDPITNEKLQESFQIAEVLADKLYKKYQGTLQRFDQDDSKPDLYISRDFLTREQQQQNYKRLHSSINNSMKLYQNTSLYQSYLLFGMPPNLTETEKQILKSELPLFERSANEQPNPPPQQNSPVQSNLLPQAMNNSQNSSGDNSQQMFGDSGAFNQNQNDQREFNQDSRRILNLQEHIFSEIKVQ